MQQDSTDSLQDRTFKFYSVLADASRVAFGAVQGDSERLADRSPPSHDA